MEGPLFTGRPFFAFGGITRCSVPLSQIKAKPPGLVQFIIMDSDHKFASVPASSQLYPARNLAEMRERLGLDAKHTPCPARWPTGVSLLAQMVDACQRCDTAQVCNDWLARAPKTIAAPPAFCPNADALKRAKA